MARCKHSQVHFPVWIPGCWGEDCDQQEGDNVQVLTFGKLKHQSFGSFPKAEYQTLREYKHHYFVSWAKTLRNQTNPSWDESIVKVPPRLDMQVFRQILTILYFSGGTTHKYHLQNSSCKYLWVIVSSLHICETCQCRVQWPLVGVQFANMCFLKMTSHTQL